MTDIDDVVEKTAESYDQMLLDLREKKDRLEKLREERTKALKEEESGIIKEITRVKLEKKAALDKLEAERIRPWREARLQIGPVDREKVESLLSLVYKEMEWEPFDHVIYTATLPMMNHIVKGRGDYYRWRGSYVCSRCTALERFTSVPEPQDPLRVVSPAAHRYVLNRIPQADAPTQLRRALLELGRLVHDFYPRKTSPVVALKPVELHLDEQNRLHSLTGPAVVWESGERQYYVNGVSATKKFISGKVTLNYIQEQTNSERKRILIERYGEERYLKDRKAVKVQQDDYGSLWEILNRGFDQENEQFIEVVNASPEPDGSYRKFFLRVPPYVSTCHEGVAWTFGETEDTYSPKQES